MATLGDNTTNINGISFAPNILDQFESYTYNFSLKLYQQSILESNTLPSPSDRYVTIAESGATSGFSIKRVEMQSVPGTTRENKGSTTLRVRMELDEPLGFTFIDRLLQAGQDLGLVSMNNLPCVLELDFVGWDENGNIVKPAVPTKTWILNLISVLPELKKGGAQYTLEFVPRNEQVQQQSLCTTSKTIKFIKGNTLKETLNNLSVALTQAGDIASEQTNYTVSGSKNDPTRLRDIYNITTQDGDTLTSKLSNWTMASNTTQNAQRQFEVTNSSDGSTQFEIVIHPGKDIFEIITALLGNTNEAYKFVCPAATPGQADFNQSEFTNFFHFDTSTLNQTYDPKTGGYVQQHNITIVPKVVSRNSILTTTPGDSTSVTNLISNNLLVKAYEYMFTGENTSVIDASLNFSSMWTDSMPLFISLLRDGQLSANLAPNTMPIDNILPQVPAVNKSTVVQNSNQTTPFALSAKRPDLVQPTKYLEDYPSDALTIESFANQQPDRDYSQIEKYTKGYSTPGDQSSIAKLSIFGYLADNSLVNMSNKPGVSSMLQVTLVVRGDPYWLGITSEEVNSIYNGSTYVTLRKNQRDYAVYQSGEHNFYLKFRPPQTLDSNTGLIKFDQSSIFNTMYSVLSVNHIFENGTFKQELQAVVNRSFQGEAVQNTANPLLTQSVPTTSSTTSIVAGPSAASNAAASSAIGGISVF